MAEESGVESGDSSNDLARSFRTFRERYVFNPWGLNADTQERSIKAIQYLDKELQSYPWYRGLSVFGSTFFGYVDSRHEEGVLEKKESDIDVIVMYEDKQGLIPSRDIGPELRALQEDVQREFGLAVHFDDPADITTVSYDTSGHIRSSDINVYALRALSYWSTQVGSKRRPGDVRSQRRAFKEVLEKLPAAERANVKRILLDSLLTNDEAKETKISQRIPDYDGDGYSVEHIMKSRKLLWEERIHDLFGL